MKEQDTKSILLKVGFWVLVTAVLIFNLFPAIYALVSSFRPSQELFSTEVIPRSLTFAHYKAVFADARFVRSLLNSIIIAGSTVIIALGLGSLCAYALGTASVPFQGVGALFGVDDDDVPTDRRALRIVRHVERSRAFQYAPWSSPYLFDLYAAVYRLGDDNVL